MDRRASVDDVAKKKTEERTRALPYEELKRDRRLPGGVDGGARVIKTVKIPKSLNDVIEKHRGDASWSKTLFEVLEAGLEALGWKFRHQVDREEP